MVWSIRALIKKDVNTEVEQDLLHAWEENVDAGLEAAAMGSLDENFIYNWTIPPGAPRDTLMELITRYRQAGWNIQVLGTTPNRYLQFEPNSGWKNHFIFYNSL